MTSSRFLFLAVAVFLPSISAAKTTAEQARTMPMQQLAQKLLGESGSVMIDVDRPRFEGILESVRFYSHAMVTGSQFGMCGADWVTVGFDENGEVETVSSQRRYGVAGDIYRAPGTWSYDESGKICASVTSTRNYFPAPDSQSALEIAWYVDAISGNGPFAKQTFGYSCTGLCSKSRGDLKWLRLDKIASTRTIDCPKSSLKLPSCFEVVVGENKVGPFPKIFRIYGTTYMNKVIVSNVVVDVGSTLE
ncbi:hypothetical protein [Dyella sp.]|uniref:hypothetical protein n=1 Tax=Dyella sp. TaxID=1869338 RepID=UPI002D782568|nr:hypothetical protein [Dyella sp.]HET7332233.1 hypothetical protein [Dyella sp.]